MILKRIMENFNYGCKDEEKQQPWQVFDLMGGTSTGGQVNTSRFVRQITTKLL